jgi:hypothetical protein
LWYAKSKSSLKFRPALRSMLTNREVPKEFTSVMEPDGTVRPLTADEKRAGAARERPRIFRTNTAVSPEESATLTKEITFHCGIKKFCGRGRHWKTGDIGLYRLEKANRFDFTQGPTRMFRRFLDDNEYFLR